MKKIQIKLVENVMKTMREMQVGEMFARDFKEEGSLRRNAYILKKEGQLYKIARTDKGIRVTRTK